MNPIDTITFEDADEHCEATAIVRAAREHVVVALTIKTDGDMQVVMPRDAATRLHAALRKAPSLDQ